MKAIKKAGKSNQRGQGMTEYIIIVALIAVAAIGVMQLFGKTARNQVAGMAEELGGAAANTAQAKAATSAGKAATEADKGKDMATYHSDNRGM